jgi:hypothetical protein
MAPRREFLEEQIVKEQLSDSNSSTGNKNSDNNKKG